MGYAFFAPSWILGDHLPDQCTQIAGQGRAATWFGFLVREESEPLTVPADQSIGLDRNEHLAPGKETSELRHQLASRLVGALWSDLTFLIEGQLFSQKQIFSHQSTTRPGSSTKEFARFYQDEGSNAGEQRTKSMAEAYLPQHDTLREVTNYSLTAIRSFCGP
jgi:hypothetical protein